MAIFVFYGKFGTRKCWINESPMKVVLSLGGLSSMSQKSKIVFDFFPTIIKRGRPRKKEFYKAHEINIAPSNMIAEWLHCPIV